MFYVVDILYTERDSPSIALILFTLSLGKVLS